MTYDDMAAIHALSFTTPRPWNAQEFAELLVLETVFSCSHSDGFILGRIAGPEAELLTLAIHPRSRRQGLGTQLLKEFGEAANARGASEIFLEVAAENRAAHALYINGGYVAAGIRKDYYAGSNGQKVSAIVMRCNLVASFP